MVKTFLANWFEMSREVMLFASVLKLYFLLKLAISICKQHKTMLVDDFQRLPIVICTAHFTFPLSYMIDLNNIILFV